jgi:hypothetical protein
VAAGTQAERGVGAAPDAEAAILTLVRARGSAASICPTEAARLLAEDWRGQLGAVRAAALRLMARGELEILRKGRPVREAGEVRGVIRLRLPAGE